MHGVIDTFAVCVVVVVDVVVVVVLVVVVLVEVVVVVVLVVVFVVVVLVIVVVVASGVVVVVVVVVVDVPFQEVVEDVVVVVMVEVVVLDAWYVAFDRLKSSRSLVKCTSISETLLSFVILYVSSMMPGGISQVSLVSLVSLEVVDVVVVEENVVIVDVVVVMVVVVDVVVVVVVVLVVVVVVVVGQGSMRLVSIPVNNSKYAGQFPHSMSCAATPGVDVCRTAITSAASADARLTSTANCCDGAAPSTWCIRPADLSALPYTHHWPVSVPPPVRLLADMHVCLGKWAGPTEHSAGDKGTTALHDDP